MRLFIVIVLIPPVEVLLPPGPSDMRATLFSLILFGGVLFFNLKIFLINF